MTRLYLPQPLQEGAEIALPPSVARHAVQVLRLRVGAIVTLFNGQGGEHAAEIVAVGRRDVTARVGPHSPVERESSLNLTLAQCVSKGERMDYTVQKAVELGVTGILPLISARSVVKLDAERWDRKCEHWRAVIASACEQCGRNCLPTLAAVRPLNQWLTDSAGLRLMLTPRAGKNLGDVPRAAAATLLVGPEGGWTDEEIVRAAQAGCTPVGLGPRVLRTETAGVAAVAAIQALWGDLGQSVP